MHDETARQSRSAFKIGLSRAPPKFGFKFSKGPMFLGGTQRFLIDCYVVDAHTLQARFMGD